MFCNNGNKTMGGGEEGGQAGKGVGGRNGMQGERSGKGRWHGEGLCNNNQDHVGFVSRGSGGEEEEWEEGGDMGEEEGLAIMGT